jgi:hypothetical protein
MLVPDDDNAVLITTVKGLKVPAPDFVDALAIITFLTKIFSLQIKILKC